MKEKNTDNQTRYRNLDVYKGVCIILIIVTHFSWSEYQRKNILFPFLIEMAVPVFMTITGYVSSMSLDKKGADFKSAYHPRIIICKWLRFLIPYLPIYLVMVIYSIVEYGQNVSFAWLIKFFIVGGLGPGSYYFTVMIQAVLMIPIIYWIVSRWKFRGLLGCFTVNVLYEIIKTIICMSPDDYRLLAFRYIYILAYGCYLYVIRRDNIRLCRLCSVIIGLTGAFYIVLFYYTSLKPWITDQWTLTSVFAVLFLFPIMQFLVRAESIHCRMLELVGKASYNIMYAQLLYYVLLFDVISKCFHQTIVQLVMGIIVSCVAGIVFYKTENPITRKVITLVGAPLRISGK